MFLTFQDARINPAHTLPALPDLKPLYNRKERNSLYLYFLAVAGYIGMQWWNEYAVNQYYMIQEEVHTNVTYLENWNNLTAAGQKYYKSSCSYYRK